MEAVCALRWDGYEANTVLLTLNVAIAGSILCESRRKFLTKALYFKPGVALCGRFRCTSFGSLQLHASIG